MRRFSPVYCFAFVALFFTACSREEIVLTDKQVDARIDSIVRVRTEFETERAAEDLDRRQAIEVKVKTDSIIDARTRGVAPATQPPPPDREP